MFNARAQQELARQESPSRSREQGSRQNTKRLDSAAERACLREVGLGVCLQQPNMPVFVDQLPCATQRSQCRRTRYRHLQSI